MDIHIHSIFFISVFAKITVPSGAKSVPVLADSTMLVFGGITEPFAPNSIEGLNKYKTGEQVR